MESLEYSLIHMTNIFLRRGNKNTDIAEGRPKEDRGKHEGEKYQINSKNLK